MRTAIYPGTFDPITLGHIDVIMKSLKIFDKIIVATTNNSEKNYFFSIDERLSIIRNSLFKDMKMSKKKVVVIPFDILTIQLCKKYNADIIFTSTSRIYNIENIDNLNFKESKSRFVLKKRNLKDQIKNYGITENFPNDGKKSFYGATKLTSEIIINEYLNNFNFKGIINRCSVISGPGQFGKKEQGIFMFWLKSHIFLERKYRMNKVIIKTIIYKKNYIYIYIYIYNNFYLKSNLYRIINI